RGDPLPDHRLGARVLVERAVAVRMDVHEAGGDGEAARVDLVAAGAEPGADRGDPAGEDPDVEAVGGERGAAQDGAPAEHEVELAAPGQPEGRREREGARTLQEVASGGHGANATPRPAAPQPAGGRRSRAGGRGRRTARPR